MTKLTHFVQFLKTVPTMFFHMLVNVPRYTKTTLRELIIFFSFFSILLISMVDVLFSFFNHIPLIAKYLRIILKPIAPIYNKITSVAVARFEALRHFKIKRKYLIFVSIQNLKIRRSRSIITILGMSVGVGIIVLLLSLGYGIERLVIKQIASLNELKMIDVSAGESSTASLTNEAVKQMSQIEYVEDIIPLISVVGRLNYKNAKTDVLVHAVPKKYFDIARTDITHGDYFKNAPDYVISKVQSGSVAGTTSTLSEASFGDRIVSQSVMFQVIPGEEAPVYEECTIQTDILGFTTRQEGNIRGFQVYGDEYAPFEMHGRVAYDKVRKVYLGEWIKADFPLYTPDVEGALADGYTMKRDIEWRVGCVPLKYLQVEDSLSVVQSQILGEATSSAQVDEQQTTGSVQSLIDDFFDLEVATDSAIFSDLEYASGSGELEIVYSSTQDDNSKKDQVLEFEEPVSGSAVVSSGLLRLLGVEPVQYKNESVKVSFIIIKSLLPELSGRVLTSEEEYEIVGVFNDDENQSIYIPIQDMNVLGITNYSQVKVMVDNERNMDQIRKSIEQMGYKTASTADTVAQVETFFAGFRNVLGFLGFIALGVASLGMFNTLTVSLLERSREIGGMKTMGMVSGEIQELFLAEAMIMGLGGGLGGIILGALTGQVLSYGVSLIAIAQGVGYLELTYIPLSLIVFIISCSFVVGVITGLYPAYRAKKISALNALRYE